MHIRCDLRRSNDQVSTPDELRNDNRIYRYKRELARRNIEFIMTEEDLRKCHNDTSEVLFLKITLCSSGIQGTPKSASHKEIKPPIEKKRLRASSLFNNKPKISPKLKISDTPIPIDNLRSSRKSVRSEKEINNFTITIKRVSYLINYKWSSIPYSSYKIENVNEVISCYGILDNEISLKDLKDHEIHDTFYNDRVHQIITPHIFDGFCTYMIVCILGTNYTIDFFVNIFPNIIDIFFTS
jgi:hypothetical protein